MSKRKNTFPLFPIGEYMAQETGKRISHTAKVETENILDLLCEDIVTLAIILCEHSKRTTLKGEDIILAYKQLKSQS